MSARSLVPRAAVPAAARVLTGVGQATSRWRMEPSFIVIGGQRCGTTSIFADLAQHPQVLRPPAVKGTDYYSMHYDRDLDWYRGHFPLRRTARLHSRADHPVVAFEACTYYMFHPYAIARLAADFPDIKLVAMLRDPVERAFSAYKHEFARGFETESDFSTALALEDERLAGADETLRAPNGHSFAHRHHAYRRRGEFGTQLARVFEHFARERVHVMDSEAFFADPASEYAQLLDFLGLDHWRPPAFEVHNARPSKPMPADAHDRLTAHFRPLDDELADLLGRKPYWSR